MKERIDIRKINDELTVIFSEFSGGGFGYTVYFCGNEVMDNAMFIDYSIFNAALKKQCLEDEVQYIKQFYSNGDDANSHDNVDDWVDIGSYTYWSENIGGVDLGIAKLKTIEHNKNLIITELKDNYESI